MIILKIKYIIDDQPIQGAVDELRECLPNSSAWVGAGTMPGLARDDDHYIYITLNQDSLTDDQRDYLHMSYFAQRHIDEYSIEPGCTEVRPILEPWEEMKREMEDLRQRVSVLERNNSNVIHKRFLDFFNGMDLPQAPQQETIDQGRLRDLVYAVEDTVQRARDMLAPIYKDNTLNQVDTELGNAMDTILDLRETLGEE